jgi:hypothetical protein
MHRPFLLRSMKRGGVEPNVEVGNAKKPTNGVPSLDISTSAARSYAYMIHTHLTRTDGRCPMHVVRDSDDYMQKHHSSRDINAACSLPGMRLPSLESMDVTENTGHNRYRSRHGYGPCAPVH